MTMTETKEQAASPVLPEGVCLHPKAVTYLENSLRCLKAGLTISAWWWCEKARVQLDSLTNGADAEYLVQD